MTTIPERLDSMFYRSFLSHQGKVVYDLINKQLLDKNYSGAVRIPVNSHSTIVSDCTEAYKAVRDDHPEYFYLGYSCTFIQHILFAEIKYQILYSVPIIERVNEQLRNCIYKLVRGTASLSLEEQEILIYERIAGSITYRNNDEFRDHNIVGPVLYSTGVCEGINALLMLCYRRIGIPCIKVSGRTKNDGAHCWSIAWINNVPVHCDISWDCVGNNNTIRFNYFNLSDTQISYDHQYYNNGHLPICASEEINYYMLKRLCISSYSELCYFLEKRMNHCNPIMFQICYKIGEDYLQDVNKAIKQTHLRGSYKITTHPFRRTVIIYKR